MIIYKVMNNINGKIYIGQTSRGLSRRINHHIFTNRLPVARALNKYGLDKFTINVIDEAETRDDLNNKEKYWIQYYNCKTPCGYNCTDGGEGRSGFEVSKETRLKIGNAVRGKLKGTHISSEHKNKISMANKGKPLTECHKKKLSESKKGKAFSEEHKKNLSLSRTGEKHPLFGKQMPEERRKNISKAKKGKKVSIEEAIRLKTMNLGRTASEETKKKMSASMKGKTRSAETRKKMSEGNLGKRHSEETKIKISLKLKESHLRRGHVIS